MVYLIPPPECLPNHSPEALAAWQAHFDAKYPTHIKIETSEDVDPMLLAPGLPWEPLTSAHFARLPHTPSATWWLACPADVELLAMQMQEAGLRGKAARLKWL